jgi:hypothetical protein
MMNDKIFMKVFKTKMKRNNKAATIIKRVRKLVEQYPDALYEHASCYYSSGVVKNGPKTPGCIIGQACRGYMKIEQLDDANAVDELEIDGTRYELGWLSKIQFKQDIGLTWANAMKEADSGSYDPLLPGGGA